MIDQLKPLGRIHHFPKGTFLFRQGGDIGSLFVIQQGLVKAYYETRGGKEFVKSFLSEGDFIASMQAVVANKPCSFSVLSLEDTQVIEIPKQVILNSVVANPVMTITLNSMLLELAMKKERREYELLCLSPEERYVLFCEREASLVARLSQYEIAAYLGITPVALSRIRKRLGLLPSDKKEV